MGPRVRAPTLTKKGLRHAAGGVRLVFRTSSSTNPDEEGIKTWAYDLKLTMLGCSSTNPDEEGIKTRFLAPCHHAFLAFRALALTKKGLRHVAGDRLRRDPGVRAPALTKKGLRLGNVGVGATDLRGSSTGPDEGIREVAPAIGDQPRRLNDAAGKHRRSLRSIS